MHQQDIMGLYSIIFSRVGWFLVFAVGCIGWALAKNLIDENKGLSEQNKIYREKLGKE